MDIEDLLSPRSIVWGLKASSKKQVLQELARRATDITGITEREIFDVLLERERLGSTGVGQGVAIPHGKLAELDHLVGLFAKLESPVDFDAVDGEPVDLVFLLLAPRETGAEHLKALARVSRLLRDRDLCKRLRGTSNADALFALLTKATADAA